MAGMAQRYQVFRIISALRMIFQMLNMVHLCRLPLPAVSPADLTHVSVSAKNSLPHQLPARSLVKIIIFMVKCHYFPHSKADHHNDGPPLSFFAYINISCRIQKILLPDAIIALNTSGRRPAALLRACVRSVHRNIPCCRQWPQTFHHQYISASAALCGLDSQGLRSG